MFIKLFVCALFFSLRGDFCAKKEPGKYIPSSYFLLYRKRFFAMIYAYLLNRYEKRLNVRWFFR